MELVILWPHNAYWKKMFIRLPFCGIQGYMPSYSVKCDIYGVTSFASLDLCLQEMNTEANELRKIE
jgi:hypothetical protein